MKNWRQIGFRNKMFRQENKAIISPGIFFDPNDLKRKRNDLGLSQHALATALCVSVRTIVAWETGSRNMPLPCQRLFCMLYGFPFELPKAPVDDLHPDLF